MFKIEDLKEGDKITLRNKTLYTVKRDNQDRLILSRNQGKNWVEVSDYNSDLEDTRTKHPSFKIDLIERDNKILFKREIKPKFITKEKAESILSEILLEKVIIN